MEQLPVLLLRRSGVSEDQRWRHFADESASGRSLKDWSMPTARSRVSKTARRGAPPYNPLVLSARSGPPALDGRSIIVISVVIRRHEAAHAAAEVPSTEHV